MSGKAIVLDANILIRAVLGRRVAGIIFDHALTTHFSRQTSPMPMRTVTCRRCLKNAGFHPERQFAY